MSVAFSLCLAFATYTPSASAFQYDGNTEVVARIETAPSEATQPATDGDSTDDNDVSTEDIIFDCITVSFLLFLFSALVILLCCRNSRRTKVSKD